MTTQEKLILFLCIILLALAMMSCAPAWLSAAEFNQWIQGTAVP